MSEVKENHKGLEWMKVDSNKLKWVRWAGLESMFNLQCTKPTEDLLQNFLCTWEITNDGRIIGWVHGQEIIIDQIWIHEQLEISKEGTIYIANATFEEVKTTLKRIVGPHVFVENE